jgi:DNA-binding XRE family transcriptional regulator
MTVQLIKQGDQPEWAVIPYDAYLHLVEQAEMLQDVQEYDAAKAALARGAEELVPDEVVDALLSGANPIKVWREFRDKTQVELATQASISVPYLSQLEANKRKGSLEVLTAIAGALNVMLEDLALHPR